MATDKSEPRVGIIAQVGVIAIVTLLIVRGVLVAYFDHMAHGEEMRKVGSPDALISLRTDESQRLKAGAMPIDQAMQAMVSRGRMGASPDLMPSASRDIAPLQGWVKLPAEVPAAMTAPPAAPPPPPAPAASSAAPGSSAAPPSSAAPHSHAPPTGSQKPQQP
jgi:hypothetical protein